MARSWMLAYRIMSDQDFSGEIPESYRDRYGVESLNDIEQIEKDVKTFAENSVATVHRLIFPSHGIRIA